MDYNTIISEANRFAKEMPNDSNLVMCYRGQAKKWELKSKLQRDIDDGKIASEKILRWNKTFSTFENIARFQHYGEPTRLLDFSTDIDIALFFACSDYMEEEGILYMCPYVKRNMGCIETLMMSSIISLKRQTKVVDFVNDLIDKYPQYSDKKLIYDKVDGDYIPIDPYYIGKDKLALIVLTWINHGFMVIPSEEELSKMKDTNPRLYSQKGAFFVTGNKTIPERIQGFSSEIPNIIILPQLADLPSTITNSNKVKTIHIPAESKKEILYVLKNKGITAKTIYPDK